MAGTAVRVPKEALKLIQQLADEREVTPGTVIAEWAYEYEQRRFWARARASVDRLKADPDRWREMQDEQQVYDNALLDGLEEERGEDPAAG